MGEYNTELDALCHPSFRDFLRHVKLIGELTDQYLIKTYSESLTRKYIERQVVYFPTSMNKAEMFIVMAKSIFDDIIIHNNISINELLPFTMTNLRLKKTEENDQLWKSIIETQMNALYITINNDETVPSKNEIILAKKDSLIQCRV